jgi:glycerol-3-phosphate acyltransferase PlsX
VVKKAGELLRSAPINFHGNVEGDDIYKGTTDVVVCDGFVGNILLKFYESVAKLFHKLIDREMGAEVAASASMQRIWQILDYAQYGGAPLLGVQGVSIICHGRSSKEAIAAALKVAVHAARQHLVQHMTTEFSAQEAAR